MIIVIIDWKQGKFDRVFWNDVLSDQDYAEMNKFKSRTSLGKIKEMLVKMKKKQKQNKIREIKVV